MGLDMFLYERQRDYVSPYAEPKRYKAVKRALSELVKGDDESAFIVSVESEVAYWRKANQIHNWFVQNVQNGVDDCGSYPVDIDKLLELRNLCKDILMGVKPSDTLPTRSGFFFGSTDYGEQYEYDLKNTVDQLDKILAGVAERNLRKEYNEYEFIYRSSW